MIPAKYNFTDRYKNDTSNLVKFTVNKKIASVDTAIDLTGVLIKMQLKKGVASTSSVKTFEVGSGITLTDAVNGIFELDAFLLTIDAGSYVYDMQLTFPDGVVSTYIKGCFKVIQDISQ
tara:strand:- start:3122 stop:3478 length:357 start_codon:yes stop_codon:yes gene_type:complete